MVAPEFIQEDETAGKSEGDGWLLCYKVLSCDGRYQLSHYIIYLIQKYLLMNI